MKKRCIRTVAVILAICMTAILGGCSGSPTSNNTVSSDNVSQSSSGDNANKEDNKSSGNGYTFVDPAIEQSVRGFAISAELIKKDSDPITTEILEQVTGLFLHYGSNDSIGLVLSLEDLSAMPNLCSLNINYQTSITDISPLANCPKLDSIEALGVPISDISALEGCTDLWRVELSSTKVTDLTPLAGKKKLRELSSAYAPVEKVDFTGMESLDELTIVENKISDISTIKDAINLTVFNANDNPITDISGLASCTLLKQVYINNSLVTDVSPLANCKELFAIEMIGVNADYKVLDSKSVLPKLMSFRI